MNHSIIIGIDVHSKTNSLCAIDMATGEVARAKLPADPGASIGWISKNYDIEKVRCVYESGPTGTVLCRALRDSGIECAIAATSKLPRRTDAQKNDKRDAEWLARQLIAGAIRDVYVPDPSREALRTLSHLRRQYVRDLTRCKQRVSSLLLLYGITYTQGARWTKKYRAWAGSVDLGEEGATFALKAYLSDVDAASDRLAYVDARIQEVIARDDALRADVERLMMIHGIGPVTAFAFAAEVCDFSRFASGRALASYVGLCPSENSSGQSTKHGRIDKRGNSYLRRLLIESAVPASRPASSAIRAPEGVPPEVAEHARKCNKRLVKRRKYLKERGVAPCKAKVAIARELCEWIYHIMVM